MSRFKVRAGTHSEGEREYKKGEVVVSPFDLTTMFPEKFEKLADEAPAAAPLPEPGEVKKSKAPKRPAFEE